jgi:hypothetical protein
MEQRATRRKQFHEEVVRRIRSCLVKDPMVHGRKDFYDYYASARC